ncbi:hypothetical protein [Mycobacterium sp. 852014-52144_SCH5372336]|uniref:hypothetical protein n=2 Tax=Mycobacterium TaxID=1763 RepID=UPI000B07E98A|nr:hypothetical protein [Mycobacterium sp. 852014-52144_SCH5372336]
MTIRRQTAHPFLLRCVVMLAAALGCVALGCGTIASAEPVWDIEEFDNCTQTLDEGLDNTQNWIDTANEYCCKHSGGVWNDNRKECVAPPAEGQGAGPQVPPREVLPTVRVNPPNIGEPIPPMAPPVLAPGVPLQPPAG